MTEKLKIFKDKKDKYHFKTKDDRHIDIEHKDRRLKFKLHKWNREASIEVFLDMVEADNHKFIGNKIEIEDSKKKLRVYPIDTRTIGDFYGDSEDQVQCHDGGLRWELVAKGVLRVNSLTVPLVAKNLRCAYQPFLTEQDIAEGATRPLNVEGSYAFYHASKKDNQYMTGKMFHLFRPIVEDALGNKAWCSLYINPEITELTITIPQPFLDEATYPITLDPDFGYSNIGGTQYAIAADGVGDYRRGSAWTFTAANSTANYIRAYVRRSAGVGDVDCKAFINQKDSGGAGVHAQIATKENLACEEAPHWEQFDLAGEVLTNGVVYILNLLGDGDDTAKGEYYQIYLDFDGATAVASYYVGDDYGAPESPWTVAAEGTTKDYSIYCNYPYVPPGWQGKISGITNPAKIMGIPVAGIVKVKGIPA